MDTFTGISTAVLDFYSALEANNNKAWWLAHKDTYDVDVRLPLLSLLHELEPKFGPGTLFRPHRDMRFATGGGPYKSSQGAFASPYEEVGFYLHIGADGLLLGGGCRSFPPAQLSRYRSAVDTSAAGNSLARVTTALVDCGYFLDGRVLKGTPRGFPADHPHAELLRYKSLSVSKPAGVPSWLHTKGAVNEIAKQWEVLRPLVDWIIRYAAP